jgi:MoxR-like ATPase
MKDINSRTYKGDGKPHYQPQEGAWKQPEPYIADMPLVEAVKAALYLRRPLLLEGEPGCGKTRLAYAIAYELGYPLYTCYIRSTSKVEDLLYEYDALRRLYDLQERKETGKNGDPLERKQYVKEGKLGQAIKLSAEKNIPSVVLIDEIDKADIDFPNDLLELLDEMKFSIKETEEEINALQGQSKKDRQYSLPLFIITSNREKELPQPFLRRCLYYYIQFPNQEIMREIIKSHATKDFEKSPVKNETPLLLTDLFESALVQFWKLRDKSFWRKIVGTSELLDWLRILEQKEQEGKITAEELKNITALKDLPDLETLIKTQSDLDLAQKISLSDS